MEPRTVETTGTLEMGTGLFQLMKVERCGTHLFPAFCSVTSGQEPDLDYDGNIGTTAISK